jgi:hypothetical protein
LFPPVIRAFPEGVEGCVRELAGARDAALLASALALPAFAPLVEQLERLGAWCAAERARHGSLIGVRVLAVDNAELFGGIIRDGFVVCAAGAPGAAATLATMFEGARAALGRFLRRVARDLAGPLGAVGLRGPVRALWMAPDETHNGRQSVIRVRFAVGGSWAYKPRPVTGEQLLLADSGSVFARVNAMPPASGRVTLPTLRVVRGRGRDRRAYSWQTWIDRPREWGTIRRSPSGLTLAACRLAPRAAEPFWYRAGALAAACFGFGAADLYTGNLVVGRRPGVPAPLAYPIDLEVVLFPVAGLVDTGLVADHGDRGNHHVGFERLPRWCTVGGPSAGFVEVRGGLRLLRRSRAWARREALSVVADTRARVGFGAYATAYLRGMFDLWTKLVAGRAELAALVRRATRDTLVRVLIRPTAVYADELERRWLDPEAAPSGRFSREERAQLDRGDVPYFVRRATGGPLCWIDPATGAYLRAGGVRGAAPRHAPSPSVRSGARLALIELGVALRDAVAYVFDDLRRGEWHDRRRGTRLAAETPDRGSVAFDWRQADRRLTYAWHGTTITLDIAALDEAAP